MLKWPSTFAALAVTALIALPASAGAAEPKPAGVSQAVATDFSAARRHRVTVRPAYRYGRPYRGPINSFDLYAASHPYFVPGAPVGARGLRHDGIGTGAYGFGYQ
ncbi:MAG: hypothetical protein WCG92_02970 [Hyphomicrobiales bacterium]|nr:hypothetical protein [Alphaproteobacteria bacterium]